MSNNFTSVNTELLGSIILDQFVATLSPIKAFTVSATNQPSFRGDTVKVLNVQTSSVALDYTTQYTMQDTHGSSIDVVLDKHKYVSLELKDSEWRDSGLLSVEAFARSKGYALANSILTDIMSFASASFASETRSVAKSTAFSSSAIVDLSAYADSLNWPQFGRSMILTPTQHSYLRKDNVIAQTYSYGSSDVIRKGQIPSVDTWENIYKSSVVPSNTVGLCAVQNAIVFASRVVQPQTPNQYSSIRVLTDEDTGLSLTELTWHNPDSGAKRVVWTCEYGYKVGNGKGAFLLV